MNDETFDKIISTFSKEELAGMYTVISKREVEYLKDIKSLRLILMSHGEVIDMNYKLNEEIARLRDQIMALSKMALERSEG